MFSLLGQTGRLSRCSVGYRFFCVCVLLCDKLMVSLGGDRTPRYVRGNGTNCTNPPTDPPTSVDSRATVRVLRSTPVAATWLTLQPSLTGSILQDFF